MIDNNNDELNYSTNYATISQLQLHKLKGKNNKKIIKLF